MLFYWVLFDLVIFLFVLLGKNTSKLVWVFLTFFLGFRYKMGPDYLSYEIAFEKIINGNEFYLEQVEPFHQFLVSFLNGFGGNNQFLILIYAILTLLFFYKGFKFYSQDSNLLFATMSFFYVAIMFFGTTNIIRQALATSIVFYSSRFLFEKKKNFIFVLITIGCSAIHLSTFFLLPLVLLIKLDLSINKRMIILVIISVLLFIDPIPVIVKILGIFNLDYLVYLDFGRFSEKSSFYSKIITLLNLVSFLLLRVIPDKKLKNFLFNALILMYFYRVVGFHLSAFSRMDFYIKPFFIVLLAHFFYSLANKYRKTLILIPFCVAFLMLVAQQVVLVGQKSKAYTQYSINLALMGNRTTIYQIFGNHNDVRLWEN